MKRLVRKRLLHLQLYVCMRRIRTDVQRNSPWGTGPDRVRQAPRACLHGEAQYAYPLAGGCSLGRYRESTRHASPASPSVSAACAQACHLGSGRCGSTTVTCAFLPCPHKKKLETRRLSSAARRWDRESAHSCEHARRNCRAERQHQLDTPFPTGGGALPCRPAQGSGYRSDRLKPFMRQGLPELSRTGSKGWRACVDS